MTARDYRFGMLGVSIALMLSPGAALAVEPEAITTTCEMAEAETCSAPL
jgi:hypothetical protein